MKKLFVIALLITGAAAIADTGLLNGGVTVGPVRNLDAALDGGLTASRASGSSTGQLRCASATADTPGCVNTGAQTFAGAKTFTSPVRVGNYAHAALPGCLAGQIAFCTTHGSTTQCKAIGGGVFDWVDDYGSSGGGMTLATLSGNRLFYSLSGYLGTFKLPFAYTITGVAAIVRSGTGAAATIKIRFTDNVSNCDCAVHCDTGTIDACTGNCTYAANTTVVAAPNTDGCTTPPTFHSDLSVTGYK